MLNEQNPQKTTIIPGNEGTVIRKCLHDIIGGRTLDFTGFLNDRIRAGHVIIKLADGNYAPMPVLPAVEASGTGENAVAASPEKYGTLPSGASYVGINKHYVLKTDPEAAIMTVGAVNSTLVPYPMTDIMAAFKAACPDIIFEQDEEA